MAQNIIPLNDTNSPSTPKNKITEFPQELLEQILEFTDIDTALSLRATCKALRASTDSHRAWCAFVRQLQECPHISPPEEPLEDYTVDELRDWVTRRHGFQCVLKSLRTPTLRLRKLETPLQTNLLGMIPGGRWLLLGDIMGNLDAVDCEANTLELKPFIRDEYGKEDEKIKLYRLPLNFWIDQVEPRLTFMIALQRSVEQTTEERWETPFRLRLYRVQLTGHGGNATLEAGSPLYEIWGKHFGCVGPIALNDRYFIQTESLEYHTYMRVYHYDSCTSPPLPTPIDVFLPHVANIVFVLCILPSDRLALLTETSVAIYPIPASKEVHDTTLMPLHLIQLPIKAPINTGPIEVPSPLYFGKLSTVLAYPGTTAVMRVVLPNDISEEPTITELVQLSHRSSRRTALGLTSTAVLLKDRMFLLTHDPDVPREIMLGSEPLDAIKKTQEALDIKIAQEELETLQCYDEATGRIVALPSLRNRRSILLCDVYGRS